MRLLRSFPTRRSSDLEKTGARLSMSEIDADAGMSAWQDHTIKAIRESYVAAGIPAELADKMGGNTEEFIAAVTPYPEVDHYFQEGESVKIGKYKYEVIFTPGHADGMVTFYNKEKSNHAISMTGRKNN